MVVMLPCTLVRQPAILELTHACASLRYTCPILPSGPVGPIVKALTHWGPTRQLLAHAMSLGGEKMACWVSCTDTGVVVQLGGLLACDGAAVDSSAKVVRECHKHLALFQQHVMLLSHCIH